LLFFHEYDLEVVVKLRNLKVGPYHLSRILLGEYAENLDDNLSYAHLFAVKMVDDYFAYIAQFLSTEMALSYMTVVQKKQLVVKATYYQLIAVNVYKLGVDGLLRQCMLEHERPVILLESHEGIAGGHYASKR
jgi:6-phosphogluconolactonase (cycloisomerase 2 family)